MNWSKSIIYTVSILTVVASLSSCRNRKDIVAEEPLKNRSAASLTNKLEKKSFDFDWLGLKLSTDMDLEDQSQSFKANMRMRKDSLIWVSISPALGVEMIRMLISPDSVKYFSKVPNDKHFYLGDFTSIEDFLGVDADFEMIQDLITGNPIAFNPKEDKYRSQIDGQQYVLTSKYKRKMERVVGADDKDLDPGLDSLFIDPSNKDYIRLVEKKDEEELIIKRYYLNGTSFQLEKTVFYDLFNNRSLHIFHSQFENIGTVLYPSKTRIEVQELNKAQVLEFEITRLKTDKQYDFPFEIPSDYERKFY